MEHVVLYNKVFCRDWTASSTYSCHYKKISVCSQMLEIQVGFSRLSLNHYTEVVQRLLNLKLMFIFNIIVKNIQFSVQMIRLFLYQAASSALLQEGSFD